MDCTTIASGSVGGEFVGGSECGSRSAFRRHLSDFICVLMELRWPSRMVLYRKDKKGNLGGAQG